MINHTNWGFGAPPAGYVSHHKVLSSGYDMNSSLFKLTVNIIAAEGISGSPANPVVKVNFTIPAPQLSQEEQAASERLTKFDLRHASLRASAAPIPPPTLRNLQAEGYGKDRFL